MKLYMPKVSLLLLCTTLLFAVAAALFFADAAQLPYKVAYPVLLLSVAVMTTRQWVLLPFAAAFLLSAAGDVMGAIDLFIPQMLLFALAHGAYIGYFLPRMQRRPGVWSLSVTMALLLSLIVLIVPHISESNEQVGVVIYGVIIGAMLYCVMQYRGACDVGFRCAALLFIFSDAVIAWCRFVGPVPGRTYIVMLTYYLAQYLFFRFAVKTLDSAPEA